MLPLLNCGYTYIKGRPVIKPLINFNCKAIRALNVYKKVFFNLIFNYNNIFIIISTI